MLLKPEDITQIHEKWLKQLLNIDKQEFIHICRNEAIRMSYVYNTLSDMAEDEAERLYTAGLGHSEKECALRDLCRIIQFIDDGEPSEDYILAHYHSIFNKAQVEQSKQCSCFHCLKVFPPSEIAEWCDLEEDTALCPYCGIDSVLADASGYEITEELLRKMNAYWF